MEKSLWTNKLKNTETLIWKDMSMHPMFRMALFTIVKIWKQPYMLNNRWMDMDHIHYVIIAFKKKKRNLAICNNMSGPRMCCAKSWADPKGCCAKWNQAEKDTCCMISLIYGIWKSTPNGQTQQNIHREREQTGGCQRGERGWGKTEIGEGD